MAYHKAYHPRPRGPYLIFHTLGVLGILQKGCHTITPRASLKWKHSGEGWKLTARKFTFTLAPLRRSEERTITAHAGLGWIHVRKTRTQVS